MQEVEVSLPVNGNNITIKFKDDIPWGDFQSIIKDSTKEGNLDFNKFTDR